MLCFDVPGINYQQKHFEDRYETLLYSLTNSTFSVSLSFVIIFVFFDIFKVLAPRMKCKSGTHANEMVERIIEDKGEGIMLRKIGSLYEHGKSQSLLKIKVFILVSLFINFFYFNWFVHLEILWR